MQQKVEMLEYEVANLQLQTYLKEWESSSKKIDEDDDEEDFKETDVVLLKSEQKDIINKIS